MVGRLSNTPNVGFAYEVQGVVDYLTSHGVKALPGRSFSTHRLQGLNWTINPTQVTIPMQPAEVNSQTILDGRISLSFNNYKAAQVAEPPKYNDRDEEILAVMIETQPGVFTYFDGTESEYFENYGDSENIYDKGKQIAEQEDYFPRYSPKTEPHILVNRMFPQAVLPKRKTEGSAGLDIAASHDAIIEPYGRELIHTGLRIEIPYGYYGRIASRSGFAWKHGIEVGAGVIDSDYRGEVQVLLFNRTSLPILITSQQDIAQLILGKIAMPEVYEVPHLSYTERGEQGFGSTDQHSEKLAVLVENDSSHICFEEAHAATTSPGASVPQPMDTTLNYEKESDSYLDYIQYLSSLTNTKPIWDTYSDDEWTNPFASEGGGRKEHVLELRPDNYEEIVQLIAANCEMEYPKQRVDGADEHCKPNVKLKKKLFAQEFLQRR
ncbi:hypothetical protein ZIOFF_071201 [Zingiber officinale]|uniref:dUTP diphosphatase n=1 Tax=Zingiber officinale TaxID=94328 RepID=A0A8J5EUB9_ZINOF|nr:hypothetical protein ZIOFF_071201 [Zingiber officinale]